MGMEIKKKKKSPRSVKKLSKQESAYRAKIKNLLRNNYYYNNISMAQDINKAIKAYEKER